mgnify:CR=1 FL=1
MKKRGQVTVFIILGILIVAIIAIAYSFIKKIGPGDIVSANIDEVKSYAIDCLKQVSEEAVLSVGKQGGYYNLPNESIYSPPYLVAYYIYGTQVLVPSKKIVENEIESYINENLQDCFNDFNILKNSDIIIGTNKINTLVQIKEKEVDINSKINLVVTKENSSAEISDISTIIQPVRFPHFLSFANEIAEEQTLDTRSVCVNCLSKKAQEYNLSIQMIKTKTQTDYVYIITDPISNFSSNFTFNFGAHYEFPICNDIENCANMLS